jgi:excisionase family DNA binding protein
MNDAEVRLREVARLIASYATRCRTNGVPLPTDVALAFVAATGGQQRPEVAERTVVVDAQCLSYDQVADVLGVSERTVRRLVRSGRLPHVPIGALRRIRTADLVDYVTGQRARSETDEDADARTPNRD